MIKLEALTILFNFSLLGYTSFVVALETRTVQGGGKEVLLFQVLLALQVSEASFLKCAMRALRRLKGGLVVGTVEVKPLEATTDLRKV
jgi:hypothetical protein